MIKDEIKQLNELIVEMSGKVQTNLRYAMDCLLNYDENKQYKQVNDSEIDAYERKIETICLHLMLSERLFASDMRFVTGVITMVEDFERLDDHAEDITQFALKLKRNRFTHGDKLNELVEYVMNMVADAINSYMQLDDKLAKKVIDSDDYVDNTYLEILNELIEKDDEDKISSSTSVYTTLIVKYLERIADHATNIAEWVIYIATGYYKDAQIV